MSTSTARFRKHRHGKLEYSCWDTGRFLMGFSEGRWPMPALEGLLHRPPLWLTQVHSNRIRIAEESVAGIEGDGWIVRTPGLPVLIQTADCVPLFFWSEKEGMGGILHIGWRGWQKGIERALLDMIERDRLDMGAVQFFMGPAIERSCYGVGEDVRCLFAGREWAQEAFTSYAPGRFALDLKLGIRRSLEAEGIDPGHIEDTGLCTYCLPERFPSYRRDGKTGERIFNFLVLHQS